jgi:hypothetical protein
MTYDFETDSLVACLAFANTPRSFFQSLLRQDVVGNLSRYLGSEQLVLLARNATTADITVEDSAVAYAAIAAFALKNFTSDVNEHLSQLTGLPLPWARHLVALVREYGVPTVVSDLTPQAFRDSVRGKPTLLVNVGAVK